MAASFLVRSVAALAVAAGAVALHGTLVCAQRAPIGRGVVVGANISSISDLDADFGADPDFPGVKSRSRTGLQLGVYLTLPVAGRFSVQPELHYTQKGGRSELTLPDVGIPEVPIGGTLSLGYRLAYVDIPVLARLDLGTGRWRPFVVAGPSVSLRTSCKATVDAGSFNFSADCDEGMNDPDLPESGDGDDPIKQSDFSAVGGLGISGQLLGRTFTGQLRWSQGLSTIVKDAPPGLSPRNRGLSLLVGLAF